jgi:GDP-L-fucose synthase
MKKESKIYVAGHRGLVGSSIVRKLKSDGYTNLHYMNRSILDLRIQKDVKEYFEHLKPEYVFLAAAKVGGINYNKQYPADFILDNLQIQNNIIDASYKNNITKLMFLGSACIYPRDCQQPIKEEYLMTGPLEPTNEGYALAKIAGLKMAKMYNDQYGMNAISVMPANVYGVNDNFDINNSHVIPAMIKKFSDAKLYNTDHITLFGDGSSRREFLYVDDLADVCVKLMNEYDDPNHINVGSDVDYSIKELAEIVKNIIGYNGNIVWDTSKPNGTPRRKLDVSRMLDFGWKPRVSLEQGLHKTVRWYDSFV